MAHPQGNGIAQNIKYEEMIYIYIYIYIYIKEHCIYISSKFAQKQKMITPKLEKGFKRPQRKQGAYDNVRYVNMLYVMICYTTI